MIKSVRVLVGNEMVAGNYGELGAGNALCYQAGVLVFNHILIAYYHQRGTFYLREFCRINIGVVYHQSE